MTAKEREATIGMGVSTGLSSVSIILSVAAIALAATDHDLIITDQNNITDLQSKVPILVDDGANVAGSVSIIGDEVLTDPTTLLPKLHVKGLLAGAGIDIEASAATVTISNTAEVTLTAATPTETAPTSLVATTSTANFPVVRNLKAGAGIALTLSGNDIIISLI